MSWYHKKGRKGRKGRKERYHKKERTKRGGGKAEAAILSLSLSLGVLIVLCDSRVVQFMAISRVSGAEKTCESGIGAIAPRQCFKHIL